MERHHDPPDGTASAGWVQIWDSTSYTGSYTGNTDGGYLAQDNNLGTLNDHVRSARFTRSILGDAPRWSLRGRVAGRPSPRWPTCALDDIRSAGVDP